MHQLQAMYLLNIIMQWIRPGQPAAGIIARFYAALQYCTHWRLQDFALLGLVFDTDATSCKYTAITQ